MHSNYYSSSNTCVTNFSKPSLTEVAMEKMAAALPMMMIIMIIFDIHCVPINAVLPILKRSKKILVHTVRSRNPLFIRLNFSAEIMRSKIKIGLDF